MRSFWTGTFFFELYQKIIIQAIHAVMKTQTANSPVFCGDRQDGIVLAYTAFSIPPEFLIFTEKSSRSILIYIQKLGRSQNWLSVICYLIWQVLLRVKKMLPCFNSLGEETNALLKHPCIAKQSQTHTKCCVLWVCFILWIYGLNFTLWFVMFHFQLQRHEYNWCHAWNQTRIKEFFFMLLVLWAGTPHTGLLFNTDVLTTRVLQLE